MSCTAEILGVLIAADQQAVETYYRALTNAKGVGADDTITDHALNRSNDYASLVGDFLGYVSSPTQQGEVLVIDQNLQDIIDAIFPDGFTDEGGGGDNAPDPPVNMAAD